MKIKLHRGVMLFALIWTLAAFLPPVRELKRIKVIEPFSTLPARKLRHNSHDPVATVWNLEENLLLNVGNQKANVDQWDALIASHPTQTWIAAARLRIAPLRNIPRSKEFLKRYSNAHTRQLEKAIDIATQAAKIEPDNTFWPWMEAFFYFTLGKNSQGAAAMERAGQTKQLNDYARSITHARLVWWLQHDNPTFEERSEVLMYQETVPQWFAFRDASEAASREAARAHKRGDDDSALRIAGALLQANQIYNRDSEDTIGNSILRESDRDALSELFGIKLLPKDRTYEGVELFSRNLQQRWTALCRANGRSDLANRADWLLQNNVHPFGNENLYWSDLWMQSGLKAPWGVVGGFAPYGLLALATWCFLLALVWLCGTRLLWRGPQESTPTRGQITTCANFGFWSLATTWLVAALSRKGELLTMLTPGFGQSNFADSPGPRLAIFAVSIAFLCWLLPVFFTSWKRNRRFRLVRSQKEARALGRKFGRARLIAWLLFFLLATVVVSNGRGLWDDTLLQLGISAPLALICLGVALTLEDIRFRRSGRGFPRLRLEGDILSHPETRVWKWSRNGSLLVATACFYVTFLATSADWHPLFSAFSFPAGLVGVGIAAILNRKVTRGDSFAFSLAVQSAGVLSLAFSFAFLLLSLGAWPLRAELNRQFDYRLTIKESDWIQEQIAKNPSPSP